MVEVFISDINSKAQAEKVLNVIRIENDGLKINFDLNETEHPFPCGHTILRVEANEIFSDKIIATVTNLGLNAKF